MIHFSTLSSGLYPAEDVQFESSEYLSAKDQEFYNSIKNQLNTSLLDPKAETIRKIMEYSSRIQGTKKY